jgi:hypothetical protein
MALYSASDGYGLELCILLHQPGLLRNIRWMWPGTVHSVASAWPSTQHQMGVAWNYALCCISLAFYSASDGCGQELYTLLHQPGLLLTLDGCGLKLSTLLHQPDLLLTSDGCGLELCTLLDQPGLLLSIRWMCFGAMHSVASAWTSTQHQMGVAWNCAFCCISLAFYSASDGCGLELCTLLYQSGLLLSIRWVWPGAMHSVASAWISAPPQRILLGLEQCTLMCQYGPLLSIR